MKIFIFSLLVSVRLFAGVDFGPVKTSVFKNKNCKKTKTCGLEEFRLDERSFTVRGTGWETPSHSYKTVMSYTVKDKENYQDYVVVQYIKGCVFYSYLDKGEENYLFTEKRPLFDETRDFNHKDWHIDSIDSDPMYANIPESWKGNAKIENRHSRYMTGKLGVFDESFENYIGVSGAKTRHIFTIDRPVTSFIQEGLAKNASLKFKSCIYRAKDVPLKAQAEDYIKNPIACLDWEYINVYNHTKKRFEKGTEIHPACSAW